MLKKRGAYPPSAARCVRRTHRTPDSLIEKKRHNQPDKILLTTLILATTKKNTTYQNVEKAKTLLNEKRTLLKNKTQPTNWTKSDETFANENKPHLETWLCRKPTLLTKPAWTNPNLCQPTTPTKKDKPILTTFLNQTWKLPTKRTPPKEKHENLKTCELKLKTQMQNWRNATAKKNCLDLPNSIPNDKQNSDTDFEFVRLTAGVSCGGWELRLALETGKSPKTEKAQKTRRVPTVSCTHC